MATKFNLNQFKAGKKAQNKLGNPARFITVSNNNELIVAVKPRFGEEQCEKFTLDGKKLHNPNSVYDLEMV